MISTDQLIPLCRLDAVEPTGRGLEGRLGHERLRVDVIRPGVIRIKISRGGWFDETPTYAVTDDSLAAAASDAAPFSVEDADDGVVRIRTDEVVVSVSRAPFRIDIHRHDGSPVIETAMDALGRPGAYATRNDTWAVRRRCRPEDAFFGLGEKSGRLDRKGRDFTMWNTDVLDPHAAAEFTAGRSASDPRRDRTSTEFDPYYLAVPFLHHRSAAGGAVSASFVDNGYRGRYDFTEAEAYAFEFAGGQYTEYVFAGPDMATVLREYTALTGRIGLPPLWALGYHQCRWFRYTAEAVEAMAARFRELGIPCDALWLDIEHMDGYRVFTWDRELFPDPEATLGRLAAAGFRTVTIADPGVKFEPGYPVFDEALAGDLLCRTDGGDVYLGEVWPGDSAFPDFARAEVRAWWGERTARHVGVGVDGVWNDMNEPATGSIAPSAMRFCRGRDAHDRYHNQYGLLMAMGTVEGLGAARPGRRPFVLSRAGFAGIQRYAANWMGDNLSRWDHLALSIPMATGLGLSGQPFVGADVGGFRGDCDGELFLRWLQCAVFTPFCRNHTELGTRDQYVWSFGPVVRELAAEAIRLRYRLLPYLYACFVVASETGAPVQRALVFDYQDDDLAAGIDDEFLLGPDLLVAPVLEPGATARHVYLPEGLWYDWHSGEPVGGRRFVRADTPMEHIPVFARGGAVIPMWPDAPPCTAASRPEAIALHLFVPEDDGRPHVSLLQEDDGGSDAANDGALLRTAFEVRRRGSILDLVATVAGEGFEGFARTAFHLHVHGGGVLRAEVDGRPAAVVGDTFAVADAGTGFRAVLTLA